MRGTGPAASIEYADLPTPSPAEAEVLVRMEASAVNHVDLFVRSGSYRTPMPVPFVIGRDLVGLVAAVGTGVRGFAVGDRVWCNSLGHGGRQGAFAEYAVVAVDRLYHLPVGVAPIAAAAVLHPAGTAHLGLVREARLVAGETVYVAGAGGAVGSAVVQLAHAAGARVLASARAADHDRCRESGADVVLDYRRAGLLAAVREAAPDGVDVWWDTSGHHDLQAWLPLLRQGGRMVVMAGRQAAPALPVGELYTRDLSLLGFAISNASVADLAAAAATTNGLLAQGRLAVRVAEVLPLSEARRAHELLEAGLSGRIVVVP